MFVSNQELFSMYPNEKAANNLHTLSTLHGKNPDSVTIILALPKIERQTKNSTSALHPLSITLLISLPRIEPDKLFDLPQTLSSIQKYKNLANFFVV